MNETIINRQEITPEEIEMVQRLIRNQCGSHEERLEIPENSFHQSGGNIDDFFKLIKSGSDIPLEYQRQMDGTIHCVCKPTSGAGGVMDFYIKPEALEAQKRWKH